jgi:TetR/AcrR family transcriptional regulator, mexJK operon transcriptional repressor
MPKRRTKVPVSRNPEIVRSRILDAAQAEFRASGYEAASTNRITEAFEGSKSTLFRYFPSKEKLLEAVVERIASQWLEAVDWRQIPKESPEFWLTTFGVRTLRWIQGDGPLFVGRLAISEGHKFPALEQTFQSTAGKPLQAALAKQLASWERAGLLVIEHPVRDAVHFLDLVVAGPVSRRLYGERSLTTRESELHVARCVQIFLSGCRKV